jgi:hypothetical protein
MFISSLHFPEWVQSISAMSIKFSIFFIILKGKKKVQRKAVGRFLQPPKSPEGGL